uniref:Uncharacterized protein n=1 Tax=Anguilla anguilla TaxID=7936 RepID=A0A0E9W0K2_ANGAN
MGKQKGGWSFKTAFSQTWCPSPVWTVSSLSVVRCWGRNGNPE